MHLASIAEAEASKAYKDRELKIWKKDLESAPHGEPWSTSFHASKFPGDPNTACGRQALYGLMNIPNGEPVSDHLRAIMDAGKAIENEYVSRWEESGVLLSRPPTDKYQTGYTDFEHWLTGNMDSVILPEGWNRGHVVEVKSKDHQVIDEMRSGMRSYEDGHYFQLQVYLGFLQTHSFDLYEDWRFRCSERDDTAYIKGFGGNLTEKVETGSILYVSRNRPRHTKEYVFDFDAELWEKGREILASWKDDFINGILPSRDPGWKWLDQPCKYCPVKRLCKADHKEGVVRLRDSNAITHSTSIRPDYDYLQQRKSVLKRWKEKDKS